jgi:hypothetical protein
VEYLNNNIIQWLYERRITNLLQVTPISNNLEGLGKYYKYIKAGSERQLW